MIKFNINQIVLVKLTDYGRMLRKRHHDEFVSTLKWGDTFLPYKPIQEDENGYSKWQLWHLMQEFGYVLSNGGTLPFETDIMFDETKT